MSNKGRREVSSNEAFKTNVKLRMNDLWPDEIAPAEGEVPPITILKQQASLLGLRTKNLIEADVDTGTTDYQRHLRHTLFLVAPALNFYRYPLLEVEHPVTQMYPALIRVTSDDPSASNTEIRAENEDEFKAALKGVFANAQTKRLIGNLLAQSLGT
jgi:hypothetical protein